MLLSSFSFLLVLILSGCSSGTEAAADCDPHVGPCTKKAGGYTVMLDISPKPVQHMKALMFEVMLSDDSPALSSDSLLLDLSMPGMKMGKNRVTLEKTADKRYSGTGIITKCSSGRTLWRATVFMDDNTKPAFTFNVQD